MKMSFASFKGCFSEHCSVDHVGRPLISKPHKLHRRQLVVSARLLRTWPRATIRANLPHRVRPYELRCSDPCSSGLYQGTCLHNEPNRIPAAAKPYIVQDSVVAFP
jgi:hypothetical protein